ncbi:MAG TPA: disulfide bond formation protein B [Candidatus Paceibacterota bacterium]
MTLEGLNTILAYGTVLAQLASVAILVALFAAKTSPLARDALDLVARWGMWLSLVAVFVASALTLVYSEYFGLPPCPLCWWQRAFLYPQVVLIALGLYIRDRAAAFYACIFSVIGAGVALYHHLLQVMPAGSLPCPAEGTVSCAQRFVFEFGYITFPMMAFSIFVLLALVQLVVYRRSA